SLAQTIFAHLGPRELRMVDGRRVGWSRSHPRRSTALDDGQRDTLLPILAPMRKDKITRASLDRAAMVHAAGRVWALRDGGTSAGELASNFFWGKFRRWAGCDFTTAVPETFAMVDGRWSTGARMVAVGVAIAHRGPRDVADGQWSLAVGMVGATRVRCPRWAVF